MTAVLDAARVLALGFCPSCYVLGQPVPVMPGRVRCRAHLVAEGLFLDVDRSGQVRVVVPVQACCRPVYPTGQQAGCVRCVAVGVDRRGVSRDGAGSDPLCLPCWRADRDRAAAGERRRLVADLRERLDVDVPVGCAACGSPRPVSGCWLCGWSWLAQARVAQEAADAAEAALVAERFARIAAVAAAEGRVDALRVWADRLRSVLEAFVAEPGRGVAWSVADRPARAVWLLADVLCRDAAARAARGSRRGRPPVESQRVWGVLAVSARWSGRGAMPGRAESAQRAGTVVRVVTHAWARAEAIGWAERVERGRRLSLDERIETGRTRARTVFDLAPLHRGDIAGRAVYVPAALAVLADLTEHAAVLLAEAETELDEARARADGWTDRPELAHRTRTRAVVATTVSRTRGLVRAALTPALEGTDIDGNSLPPHAVSLRMSVYSCPSRGFSPSLPIASATPGGRRSRGNRRASRSSTSAGRPGCAGGAGSRPLQHPRPIQGTSEPSHTARPHPAWAGWAYELARAVRARWTWLGSVPLPRVAATLGAALGPDWTAEALDSWVRRARSRPLLVEPRNPLGYLRAVLEEAFTGPAAPPAPATRHTTHRRVLAVEQATADRHRREATRVNRDQDTVRPGHRSPAAEAALAAVRARTSGHLRRADRTTLLDTAPAADDAQEWPEVARPGGGLPPTLDR